MLSVPTPDLDPRLPSLFSEAFKLITLHDLLFHPQILFRILFGTRSSRASPEFDNLVITGPFMRYPTPQGRP